VILCSAQLVVTYHLPCCVCRFYFVGDEDLLEIIGNSKSVPKLQKHFKKMFAGVASVVLSEDGNEVLGISSKEGEQVWCVEGEGVCGGEGCIW